MVGCGTEKAEVVPSNVQEICHCPVWKAGDTWRYVLEDKKEWEVRVLGIDEFRGNKIYVVEDVYGYYRMGIDARTLQWTVDIDPDGRKMTPARPLDWYPFYDFPLYVGKKWMKATTGSDTAGTLRDYMFTYKVISSEVLTVPAGTFKAFKIERMQESTMTAARVTTYLWYSPEVKREVKLQFGHAEGVWTFGGQGYALKAVKLTDPQSTP